jgi:crotonobetainyl-CoA:carnitine CoA-transferase CaiB-like acyl-CoA transferase
LGYDEALSLARGELARLVLRLRSLSPAAWRPRRKSVVIAVARLAELSGEAEQRAVPALPAIADHAFADAVAVIGGDALAALATRPDEGLLAAVVATMREALTITR